jgi:hypothetical protein
MNYLMWILVAEFFVCVASLHSGGIWGNAIALVNVVTAALLATNFWEPLADWLQQQEATYTYIWDFVAIWGLFAVAMIVMRTLTDTLSRVKVRFKKSFDMPGGLFLAAWTGWVMVCFTLMTLHTAPLARNFLYGAFQEKPDSRMFFGLAPDRKWLGFVHKHSLGGLGRAAPPGQANTHEFDQNGDYIYKYAARRARFEQQLDVRVPKGQ